MARKKCYKNVFAHSEGRSVVTERFIRILKNKIYKYMISIPKNVYIDNWDTINNKYNNTYQKTIKIKPVDVISNLKDEEIVGTF